MKPELKPGKYRLVSTKYAFFAKNGSGTYDIYIGFHGFLEVKDKKGATWMAETLHGFVWERIKDEAGAEEEEWEEAWKETKKKLKEVESKVDKTQRWLNLYTTTNSNPEIDPTVTVVNLKALKEVLHAYF